MIHPVVAAAADLFEVSPADILSASRSRDHVYARQAVIYALTQRGMSLRGAAATVCRDNHTTALHSIAQVEGRMGRDADYAARVRALITPPEAVQGAIVEAADALLTDERVLVIGQQVIVPLDVYEALKRAMEGR